MSVSGIYQVAATYRMEINLADYLEPEEIARLVFNLGVQPTMFASGLTVGLSMDEDFPYHKETKNVMVDLMKMGNYIGMRLRDTFPPEIPKDGILFQFGDLISITKISVVVLRLADSVDGAILNLKRVANILG